MIYIILAFSIFSIITLIRNYANRSTIYISAMIFSLDICIFGSILYISKLGTYMNPGSILFALDYKLFLWLSSLSINYYDVLRILNIGIACFLFVIPLSVFHYVRYDYALSMVRKCMFVAVLTLFPMIYIWFYDPNTLFHFYSIIVCDNLFVKQLFTASNYLLSILVLLYQIVPMYYLFLYWRKTALMFKKRQIIYFAICILMLECFFDTVFVFGPFKTGYLKNGIESMLGFPSALEVPFYYFIVLPIIVFVIVEGMTVLIIRSHALDVKDIFKRKMMRQSIKIVKNDFVDILHSFKNTFFSIRILAERAEISPQEQQALIKRIYNVSDGAIISIARALDSFKNVELKLETYHVAYIIEQAMSGIDFSGVGLIKHYYYPDVEVKVDLPTISDALANLFHNAVDAVKSKENNKGVIEVELSAEHEWAIIRITDNGVGIKKSEIKKIFKPFYTSKARQYNWGVGLSYVYKTIKAHLGFISVESKEGEYTSFQILLQRED